MKRILLVIKGLGRGGAEQLLVSSAPYFDRERFDREVAYLLPWKNALVPELESAGLPVHCLDGARGITWLARLRRIVREGGFDLVHFHSPYPAIFARPVLRATTDTRIVSTEHIVWESYHPLTYWGNLATFLLNDHVFAVSEDVRRSTAYPVWLNHSPRPSVETLYQGIDQAKVATWVSHDGVRAELGIGADSPVIGTVGNFKAKKGYGNLLSAARKVVDQAPDVRFVLVGTGPLEGEVRAQVRALELERNVIITGFREDVPRLLAAFDVFVLASLHEGLSIALLEAMALGRPSVVTEAGGNPEVVENGRNGFVVPVKDPSALADCLGLLLSDPQLRRRLGRAARDRSAHFDIRRTVSRTEDVYEELLS